LQQGGQQQRQTRRRSLLLRRQVSIRRYGPRSGLAIRRQVLRAGPVASLDIIAISTDGARLRLGLRVPPTEAVNALASGGVVLSPPGGPGDIWRVGLGGG
jgi:hypothetical protein